MTTTPLSRLLEQIFVTEDVSREEWAGALGVSTAAISQWVRGHTVPGPDHLDAIRVLVLQDDRLPQDLRQHFEEILDRPVEEVIEAPRRPMGPTLRHYLVRPRRDAAMKLLATLPPSEQVDLLVDLGRRIRERLEPEPAAGPFLVERLPKACDPARVAAVVEQTQQQKTTLSMVA